MPSSVDCAIHKLMLFDLSINGHHPAYIQHLIHFWGKSQLPISLDIVVSPQFVQYHKDVTDLAIEYSHKHIRFIPILKKEETTLESRSSGLKRIQRSFQEWQLLCRYAEKLKVNHCLMLYFDTYQIPLAFAKISPCPVSGIYFRPTFHYQNFVQCRLSWGDRIQQFREILLLKRVLQNPQLKALFCLDPFAVKTIQNFQKQVNIFPLADPVLEQFVSDIQVMQLRKQLEIQERKSVCLLFGALTGRKGIYELLDALLLLPETLQQELCIVLAGQANLHEQERIVTRIAAIHSACTVKIISRFEFVSESDLPVYFKMADVILAPYQHHVGMSGILLHAAAAGKPVLSSNYGLMGEMVRQYSLGLAIDSSRPAEISNGLLYLLSSNVGQYYDVDKMKSFAEKNSAKKFASSIFDNIL
jgi:glycosyltransferase involved in cell wall biosynthesis